MQLRVAFLSEQIATVCSVKKPSPEDYWRTVCAPKMRAAKEVVGRKLSNTAIAAAVEEASGKNTSRQLVEAWFEGSREPYISQFFALCQYLEVEPHEVLAAERSERQPLRRISEGERTLDARKKFRTG